VLNNAMLPFGVVIPAKNSMKYLPNHVQNLSSWIDLAEQVVVVDSFSKDGTADFLKKNLRHPNIHFVDHPPGLYASWNHGTRHITSEFCYLSTVGDSVTRAGIEHLVSTASRLQSDVLVSRPDFVNEAGLACNGPEWPIDDVIKRLQLREPCRLQPTIVVAAALTHTGGAITGSCASDLFCTVTLQEYPFPLDFGVAGDGAWSLENVGRIVWAVTPEKVTTFRRHPPTASAKEIKRGEVSNNFAQMAKKVVTEWLQSCPDGVPAEICADIKRLLSISIEYERFCRRYNVFRKNKWPWILDPRAWLARAQRNELESQVNDLMQKICDQSYDDYHVRSTRQSLGPLAVNGVQSAQHLCRDDNFLEQSSLGTGYG
jgi:glycosyltransferase involved in cell wall biosynthesis